MRNHRHGVLDAGYLGAIVVAALALRLLVAFAIQPTPLAGDEGPYFGRGVVLAETGTLLRDGERAPLTILYYAGLFKAFGAEVDVARAGNALLSALTLVPIFILGRCFGGDRRSGLWAALLAALYPNFIAYSHYLWSETLFVFLTAWGLALLAMHVERPSITRCALAGVLLGLAALTREVGAGFVLVAAAWVAWIARSLPRIAFARATAVILPATLIILPWTIYLNAPTEDFAVITRTTGQNLYLGNVVLPTAETGGSSAPTTRDYYGLGRNRIESEREAKRLAGRAIADRMPWWPFEKIAHQLPKFFTPNSFAVRRLLTPRQTDSADPWSYRFRDPLPDSRTARSLAAATTVGAYVVVAILGVVGLVVTRRRHLTLLFGLFVASQLLPALVTFAASRFRLGCMLVLIVAAAPLLRTVANPFREAAPARRRSAVAAAALLLIVILLRFEDVLKPVWS